MSVPNARPAIEGSDLLRHDGRRLESYEILGPVPVDAPRCFAVRLKLAGPSEERRERYVVIGMDPIWVLRFDDYEMLMHWDHPMPTAKAATTGPQVKPK